MATELRTGTIDKRPIATLRRLWEDIHGRSPPRGLGRNLLVRALEWEAQARTCGGMTPCIERELSRLARQLARSGELDLERQVSLKPGTRLVREWQGQTITVNVLADGFEHEGRVYRSLSQLAMELTGTRWSGPRFFGLKQRSRADAKADR